LHESESMSTFISNLVHFVWGTADREPLIRKSWRDDLHAYLGGILRNKNAKLLAAGGIEDHVHVLAASPGAGPPGLVCVPREQPPT